MEEKKSKKPSSIPKHNEDAIAAVPKEKSTEPPPRQKRDEDAIQVLETPSPQDERHTAVSEYQPFLGHWRVLGPQGMLYRYFHFPKAAKTVTDDEKPTTSAAAAAKMAPQADETTISLGAPEPTTLLKGIRSCFSKYKKPKQTDDIPPLSPDSVRSSTGRDSVQIRKEQLDQVLRAPQKRRTFADLLRCIRDRFSPDSSTRDSLDLEEQTPSSGYDGSISNADGSREDSSNTKDEYSLQEEGAIGGAENRREDNTNRVEEHSFNEEGAVGGTGCPAKDPAEGPSDKAPKVTERFV